MDRMERPADHALTDYADRVLTWAEAVPPGRVLTYGDIAGLIGQGGPRQVGRVMATYGGAVPWWRVVRADGLPLPGQERRALEHYRAESTPLRDLVPGSPTRVDMRRARWQPDPDHLAGPADAPD
ncbi:cysteine methyltransferase [Streptomyces bohaiensis]|uniref:Cysteine methyltransferase n=2 Tax=Streptomyces bohaiensis TaxID=1431344 RepID=A0ABX1C7U0_9ACTN|nr:MGMT family protein [Streptomyces bohaiensis]NJQ15098.1 cysteine methyltransferase [Streptomyces bohaiensis]